MPYSLPFGLRDLARLLAVVGLAWAGSLAPAAATAGPPAATPRGYLVDISASWCEPCQRMMPTVDRLIARNYPIRKFDVDARPDLVKKYNIKGLPTLLLVIDDRVEERLEGYAEESQLLALLNRIPRTPKAQPRLPSPATPRGDERLQLVDRGGRKGRSDRSRTRDNALTIRAKADDLDVPAPSAALGPMAASVRLQVKEGGFVNYGSGTVIESKPGRTTVLTCGHLFRDLDLGVPVEVEFFRGRSAIKTLGRCVAYDLDSDVGLVEVPTDKVWPAAPIATTAQTPTVDLPMVSIGCSGGADPTAETTSVTALNRYNGPENIEVDRMPVQGRSGGGLFDQTGRIVGVCIGEIPSSERGLYAGLAAIHDLLDDGDIAYLYQPNGGKQSPAELPPTMTADASELIADGLPPAWPDSTQPSSSREGELAMTSQQSRESGVDGDDVEVVCIIRSKRDPQGTSRVVIIDRADRELLERLEGPAAADGR